MKTLFFIVFMLINAQFLYAQLQGQAKIDSLLKELPNAKEDTNHVKILYNMSYHYYLLNPDEGINYGKKGLSLAKKLNWKKGEAAAYTNLGLNFYSKSEYSKVLECWEKALSILREIDDINGVAIIVGNLGVVYQNQSDYPKALEYLDKALKMNKKLGDKIRTANALGNMAIVFKNQSDYPKALEYYGKSLKINEELGNKKGIASNLANMGVLFENIKDYSKSLEYYQKALKINKEIENKIGIAENLSNIGLTHTYQSNFPKALEYFGNALIISKELGNKRIISNNLGNMGIVYRNQSDYPKALEYFGKALKIAEELGDKNGVALNLGNMGELYLSLSQDSVSINPNELNEYVSIKKEINLNRSIEYSLHAIEIYEEIGELNGRSTFLKQLADAYKQKGDYKNSDKHIREHLKLKDSVFNEENKKKIDELTAQREEDLKQAEIEKQKLLIAEQEKREQIIINVAISGFIIMVLVITIITRLLRRSDKLLHNVLPKTIADRLKKKEHPISDHFDQASIIFIDIVGFTSMSKDADPRRIVEALNKMFTIYDGIAHKYGMEKIKTIGDSYMAAAGIPIIQKDNTHRAAQMALEVKAVMEDYHTADGTKINVRIGVDCGPVVAGVIGEHKFIYDLWSDAVNTASRMESTGEAGHIQTTQRFKDAVSEYHEYEYLERGEVMIKGIGTMKTYFLEESNVEV